MTSYMHIGKARNSAMNANALHAVEPGPVFAHLYPILGDYHKAALKERLLT